MSALPLEANIDRVQVKLGCRTRWSRDTRRTMTTPAAPHATSAVRIAEIGVFTARKFSGPSLGSNIMIGTVAGIVIEIIVYEMRWWPYSISKGAENGVFWIALIFQSLLPIWLFAIVTSKTINSKTE
jgi:hypothetical protein